MIFSRNSASEKRMVQECLNNNRHAQKKLFDTYKNAMYTIAYRMLRDESLASDAVQEGFIQVFQCLGKFRSEASLGSWIKTIIVRSTLKILNNNPAFEEIESAMEDESIRWDEGLTGETLDKAIARLSKGYRAVFLLIEVEGYSHKEVAGMLGISEGTSKSQLSRAKTILQKILKEFRQ